MDKAYAGTKDSFFGQTGQMTAAWKDFMVVAGSKGGLLEGLTTAMRGATGALRAFTAFGNAHPTAFKWLGRAIIWSLGLKLGLAALKVVGGGLLGPFARLWGLWSKYKELGSLAALFPKLAKGFGLITTTVRILGSGLLWLGRLFMANPWMLLVAGIAYAAYLIYTHWAQIKGWFHTGVEWIKTKLAAMPAWMKSIGHLMMQGLLIALDPLALVDRLLDVAKLGVTALKNYFGIKSPSRLMMAMGGHIATGLGQGIDQSAHRPLRAMGRLATGIAGAGALAVAGPAAAHGRAPMQVTINVYQRAGEDGEHLARRVAEIIDRGQRGHRLSSYADDF